MKHSLTEIIPFGSLLFAAISKKQNNDSKLDARAVRCIFIGYGIMSENKKCVMAYTIDSCYAYRLGTVIDTVSFESDPTYFPYRKGQERVLSLAGNPPTEQEFKDSLEDYPLPRDFDEWQHASIFNGKPMFADPTDHKIPRNKNQGVPQ